jgi:hypothetical protein
MPKRLCVNNNSKNMTVGINIGQKKEESKPPQEATTSAVTISTSIIAEQSSNRRRLHTAGTYRCRSVGEE